MRYIQALQNVWSVCTQLCSIPVSWIWPILNRQGWYWGWSRTTNCTHLQSMYLTQAPASPAVHVPETGPSITCSSCTWDRPHPHLQSMYLTQAPASPAVHVPDAGCSGSRSNAVLLALPDVDRREASTCWHIPHCLASSLLKMAMFILIKQIWRM